MYGKEIWRRRCGQQDTSTAAERWSRVWTGHIIRKHCQESTSVGCHMAAEEENDLEERDLVKKA